jgi:ketol-acid reductoisomerase
MYQGGLSYMRYSISDTAEHGDYTGGPRLITEETRNEMRRMLKEIQDGTYARNWIAEDKNGRPWFNETRNREQHHQIEEVGAKAARLWPACPGHRKRTACGRRVSQVHQAETSRRLITKVTKARRHKD